jgi:pyruvate kinase
MPQLFITLGPSTLTPEFLGHLDGQVDLLRLNMSHMTVAGMVDAIEEIRRHTDVPICVDTEGAQIRTANVDERDYNVDDTMVFGPEQITPPEAWTQMRPGDTMIIGFDGLQVRVLESDTYAMTCQCTRSGRLSPNKGVHVEEHQVTLPALSSKDHEAITRARAMGVDTFALSFTQNAQSIEQFERLLPVHRLIYKIETRSAMADLENMFRPGRQFLIDRGDLGKEIGAEQVPVAQRRVMRQRHLTPGTQVYMATNFLESMITRSEPTRAEISDVYTALEQGADGLVLAAETAIGQHPMECVRQVHSIFEVFRQNGETAT